MSRKKLYRKMIAAGAPPLPRGYYYEVSDRTIAVIRKRDGANWRCYFNGWLEPQWQLHLELFGEYQTYAWAAHMIQIEARSRGISLWENDNE